MITVVRSGPLTTIQDQGRSGYAHLGVPRSGALDTRALGRANALVGNPPDAAGLETTLLGCALRFDEAALVAVVGAHAVVTVDKVPVTGGVIEVGAGSVLEVGRATRGVRSYVAVSGGFAVEPVLGSRSTDTLSGLGPPKLANGMVLPVGPVPPASAPATASHTPTPVPPAPHLTSSGSATAPHLGRPSGGGELEEEAGAARRSGRPSGLEEEAGAARRSGRPSGGGELEEEARRVVGGVGTAEPAEGRSAGAGQDEIADEVVLGVWLGPRDDWFEASGLFTAAYQVSPMSNRVGSRLTGAPLTRVREGELPSEGVVLGAVQVPADGQPLIFLADHPTTGGYPVIGVVDDVTPLAQARPGSRVRFRELR